MQVQKKIKEMVIFCPLTFSIKRKVRIVPVSPSPSSLRKLAIKNRLCVLDRTFSRHFSAYFLPSPRAKQPAEASPECALITCFLYHIQRAWLGMPCPFFLLWFVNETLTLAVVFYFFHNLMREQ